MKKNFFLVVALVASTITSIANDNNRSAAASRNWTVDETFTAISAKGNVEVVLVATDSKTISLSGKDEKLVEAVHLKVEDGVLKITGGKGCSEKNRTIVYVPVQALHKVTLKGGSNLSSRGRIAAAKLHIRIEGVSRVNVKNIGDIIIDSDEKHQFNYEKSEKSIIRIEKA
jgi:hypothetical protein